MTRVNKPGIQHLCKKALPFLVLLLSCNNCRTVPPLPAANLSAPGWTVRQGQAIWRSSRKAPEIAGELLLATGTDGRAFVQFTKTPFPLVIAQNAGTDWEIRFPTENRRYSGRGTPPKRLIWLWLSRAYQGHTVPKGWSWQPGEERWHLENPGTGEFIEGYFTK